MTFDSTTLVISAALVVLAILTTLINPFLRFRRKQEEGNMDQEDGLSLPPLSLILTPHDEAEKLERHLPSLLRQYYPSGYQVIVVAEQGYPDTDDTLKRIAHAHAQQPSHAKLYITHIPSSSRYMSRKKLAVTLGVKAAQTEWVVLTEAGCEPASDRWLLTMAAHCSDDVNLVVGYGNYNSSTSAFKRFERLHEASYLMRECRGTAYRTNSNNLMFRKSEFMAQDGYLGNLNLIRGEYDFIVNKYARRQSTALVTSPQAWVIDDEPTHHTWLHNHISYLEARKYLDRRFVHSLWGTLDQIALHINYLAEAAAIIWSSVTHNWLVMAAAGFAMLLTFVLRICIGRRILKDFGEDFAAVKVIPYEIMVVWFRLSYIIRHCLSDKLEFSTHKL
jgi:hypothetical protein